jgi:hypothetical protein
VVYRRYLVRDHRAYVPDFGVFIKVPGSNGDVEYRAISRPARAVLRRASERPGGCCKARRASRTASLRRSARYWADVDAGKVSKEDLFAHAELMPQGADAPPQRGTSRKRRRVDDAVHRRGEYEISAHRCS